MLEGCEHTNLFIIVVAFASRMYVFRFSRFEKERQAIWTIRLRTELLLADHQQARCWYLLCAYFRGKEHLG